MTDLVKSVLEKMNREGDGDMIDRLSASTTVGLLIVAAVVVSAQTYVGKPIECWVPAEMSNAWHQYIENHCYVQNTYYLPFNQSIKLRNLSDRTLPGRTVSYYQWVPFVLLIQAAMFYTPRLIWRALNHISGMNFNAMQIMARQCIFCDNDKHDHYKVLAEYFHWALNLNRALYRRSSSYNCFGRFGSYYLMGAFLLTKMLYVANAVGQIFFLDTMLQTRDPLFGITLMRNLANGTEWQQSGYFPRSTLCDVEIRVPGNLHRYTIQCVLMVNVFNERLFIFLWFWSMFVAILSTINLIFWVVSTMLPAIRRRFVRRLLPELPLDKDGPPAGRLAQFADRYLGVDGVFLIRSIDDRVGSIVASKVTTNLWNDFIQISPVSTSSIEQRRNAAPEYIGSPNERAPTMSSCFGNQKQYVGSRNEACGISSSGSVQVGRTGASYSGMNGSFSQHQNGRLLH